MKNIIILFILSFVFLGCDSNNSKATVYASATAVKTRSGEIIVRESRKDEIESLNDFHRKINELNNIYPPPELPLNKGAYSVISISDDGIFNLGNGMKVKMSGIKCTSKGVSYVRKFFTKKTAKLAFTAIESQKEDGAISAYIWEVDNSYINDQELKDIQTGPSYSSTNDTVILNNWCQIDLSSPSKFRERYFALEEISRKNTKEP